MFLAHNQRGLAGVLAELRTMFRRATDVAGRAAMAHDGLPAGSIRMPAGRSPVQPVAPARPAAERQHELEARPHGAA
jgi:hypothetical protein